MLLFYSIWKTKERVELNKKKKPNLVDDATSVDATNRVFKLQV